MKQPSKAVESKITEPDVISAHQFSNNNKPDLEKDRRCGCFSCLKIYSPRKIREWITAPNSVDYLGTAICPYCFADTVIGEGSGYPITKEFLEKMNKKWF